MSKISYTNLLSHQIKSSYGETFLFNNNLDNYEYPSQRWIIFYYIYRIILFFFYVNVYSIAWPF